MFILFFSLTLNQFKQMIYNLKCCVILIRQYSSPFCSKMADHIAGVEAPSTTYVENWDYPDMGIICINPLSPCS